MPFTPFHLGLPVLTLGILYLLKGENIKEVRYLHLLLGVSVGSIIPDLQGAYSIFIDSSVPLHGFSHTLIGGVVYGFLGIPCVWIVLRILHNFKFDPRLAYSSTLFGIYAFHFVPDMLIWSDMHIFWPLSDLTVGNENRYFLVTIYLILAFITGIALCIFRFLTQLGFPTKSQRNENG